MPKQARLSGIKSFRSYTINEAAEVSGVSPRTIRSWIAQGLHVMDDERPTLIRGDDLRKFIKDQREGRKVKTAPDEFYCVCCKKARKAAEGFADCTIIGSRVKLTAFCEVCETVISKPISKDRIPVISRTLALTIERHEPTFK